MNINLLSGKKHDVELGDMIITTENQILIVIKNSHNNYELFDIINNKTDYNFVTINNLVDYTENAKGIKRIIKADKLKLIELE